MAYRDMVDGEPTPFEHPFQLYSYKGKDFILAQDDPNGFWTIRHTNGKKQVAGTHLYTGVAQAKKAIHQLPMSVFTAGFQKTVLTPKVKDAQKRGSSA